MSFCWAVLKKGREGSHGFVCGRAMVVEVWVEECVDRVECRVLVDKEWL